LKLVRFADLNLFICTKTGIRNGLVAELTEVQTRYQSLAWKHVVLLEKDLELSSIPTACRIKEIGALWTLV